MVPRLGRPPQRRCRAGLSPGDPRLLLSIAGLYGLAICPNKDAVAEREKIRATACLQAVRPLQDFPGLSPSSNPGTLSDTEAPRLSPLRFPNVAYEWSRARFRAAPCAGFAG